MVTQSPRADSGPQPVVVAVHDRASWRARGLYYDVMGLMSLLLSAVALAVDVYRAGYLRALSGPAVEASFGALVRVGLEAAVFIASFAWIASRLVAAAYRDIPKVG